MTPDKWIYRFIVLALGLTMLGCIGAGFTLVYVDKAIPDFFVAIGTGALGALAGLLAPSPRT